MPSRGTLILGQKRISPHHCRAFKVTLSLRFQVQDTVEFLLKIFASAQKKELLNASMKRTNGHFSTLDSETLSPISPGKYFEI